MRSYLILLFIFTSLSLPAQTFEELHSIDHGYVTHSGFALAIDADDRPVIAYTTQQSEYPFATTPHVDVSDGSGGWTTTDLPYFEDNDQYVYWAFDMLADEAGALHIVAHVSLLTPGQQVIYYTNASGSWTVEKIDDFGPETEALDLMFDNDGRLHVIYAFGGYNGVFNLRHAVQENDEWVIEDIVEPGSILSGAHLDQKSDGTLGTVFYQMGTGLNYAEKKNGSWNVELLQSGSFRSSYPLVYMSDDRGVMFSGGGWLWFQKEDLTWDGEKLSGNGESRQLVIDADGVIHLAQVASNDLEYLSGEIGSMSEPIDVTNGMSNKNVRLAVNSSGKPYLLANKGKFLFLYGDGDAGQGGNGLDTEVSAWTETPQLGWLYGLDEDWAYSTFMGTILSSNYPYIYHPVIGWLYHLSGEDNFDNWFYSFDPHYLWIFTRSDLGGRFQYPPFGDGEWDNFINPVD